MIDPRYRSEQTGARRAVSGRGRGAVEGDCGQNYAGAAQRPSADSPQHRLNRVQQFGRPIPAVGRLSVFEPVEPDMLPEPECDPAAPIPLVPALPPVMPLLVVPLPVPPPPPLVPELALLVPPVVERALPKINLLPLPMA